MFRAFQCGGSYFVGYLVRTFCIFTGKNIFGRLASVGRQFTDQARILKVACDIRRKLV